MDQRVDDAFLPLYQQLRAIAQSRLAGNDGATLQATAVVHEALLRLSKRPIESYADEHHILAAAAQAIRHVIVDHARNKRAAKRTEAIDEQSATIECVAGLGDSRRVDLLIDLDEALVALSDLDIELRTVVELHTFGGLGHAEIAALLNSSERTIRRRWQFAAARLRQHLRSWSTHGDEGQPFQSSLQ